MENVMMFVRYAVSAGAAYALGKGWISAAAQGPMVNGLVQLIGVLVAVIPPIWAARNVSNAPKP